MTTKINTSVNCAYFVLPGILLILNFAVGPHCRSKFPFLLDNALCFTRCVTHTKHKSNSGNTKFGVAPAFPVRLAALSLSASVKALLLVAQPNLGQLASMICRLLSCELTKRRLCWGNTIHREHFAAVFLDFRFG